MIRFNSVRAPDSYTHYISFIVFFLLFSALLFGVFNFKERKSRESNVKREKILLRVESLKSRDTLILIHIQYTHA